MSAPVNTPSAPERTQPGTSSHLTRVARAVDKATARLLALLHPQGYWCFELEADCTIPAEYIMMMHYMDEIDAELQGKIAVYLREHQGRDGGWPLFFDGDSDLSCSVKAYYALKLAGDAPEQPHMAHAREFILNHGGAARANVFTRIALALFEQIPWRGVPFIPVEIILLPKWFPFHTEKVSYWSRAVMVPLFILCSLKPKAKNPRRVSIAELFTVPPEKEKNYFPVHSRLNHFFLWLDRAGRWLEPFIPGPIRRKAVKKAEEWVVKRIDGEGGLGAIFPAMVNAYEVLDLLGYPSDDPLRARALQALKDLLVVGEESAYCQPCVSPVWDTAMSCLTLQEVGDARALEGRARAIEWLLSKQVFDEPGDWRRDRPWLDGGGWAFQFENAHYPDLDDTAMVGYAMVCGADEDPEAWEPIRLAADWICGMQSTNGGFAAFDVDNNYTYLNEIPFADHGALLDPPTSDVSARCLMFLMQLAARHPEYRKAAEDGLEFLLREQEPDGSWYGRWGTNYIYGTWSVLIALEAAGVPQDCPPVHRAVNWLKHVQREDGGWGEGNDTYYPGIAHGRGIRATSFQTAWAVLGLMAAGEGDSMAVHRGIHYLLRTQRPDGLWDDDEFTSPGFPRVFYLKYHGYEKYFPLWALARYRNLQLPERAL